MRTVAEILAEREDLSKQRSALTKRLDALWTEQRQAEQYEALKATRIGAIRYTNMVGTAIPYGTRCKVIARGRKYLTVEFDQRYGGYQRWRLTTGCLDSEKPSETDRRVASARLDVQTALRAVSA